MKEFISLSVGFFPSLLTDSLNYLLSPNCINNIDKVNLICHCDLWHENLSFFFLFHQGVLINGFNGLVVVGGL